MSKESKGCKKQKWLSQIATILLFIFIIVVGLVCLKGLVESVNTFVENQQTFNKAYGEAAAAIANLSPEENAKAQASIDHLEQLQQIQKNAATSDVMSFIYSVLSTILVGLCAGFVAKCHKDAEEVKNAVDKANVAVDTVKFSAHTSNENAEKAKKSAEKASQIIKQQKDAVRILSIHIEIVHARASLLSHDRIGANQRIFNISRLILKLPISVDSEAILQLQQELLGLETVIELFREHAENLQDGGEKTSMLQAIDRYVRWTAEAVKHCEKLLREIPTDSGVE